MKKGFTLIELLAVIVILAIIALIATPIVLGIIEDVKESAQLRSAEMYLGGVEQSIMQKNMNLGGNFRPVSCDITSDGNLYCDNNEDIIEIEMNGEKPKNGKITFENGKIKDAKLIYETATIIKNSKNELVKADCESLGNFEHKLKDGTIESHDTKEGNCSKCGETVLAPGLYDENDNLMISWSNLLSKNYQPITYWYYEDYYDEEKDEWIYIEEERTSGILNIDSNGNLSGAFDSYDYINKSSEYLTGKLVIDDSVTGIKDYGFSDCVELIEIIVPNSVTSIGSSSFANCTSLLSIEIPDSVEEIDYSAFSECTSLTEIEIPNNLTTIKSHTFHNCRNLTKIEIPNNVTQIENYAFSGCTGLTEINFPTSLTSIGNSAFSSCTGLTEINFPTSLTSIGNYAFSGCTGLTEINFPTSLTSIGNYAFSGCTELTEINFPTGLTSIGNYAFSGCIGLTEIYIPKTVTNIGITAFSNCSQLNNIKVDLDNTAYDSRNDCNAIIETATNKLILGCKHTIIPDSVEIIGDSAFSGCTELTEINLPAGLISIGNSAFRGCTGLTEINLPAGLTSIGSSAFSGCTGLTKIKIPDSVETITASSYSTSPFYNCSENLMIHCDINSNEIPSGWSTYWRAYKSGGCGSYYILAVTWSDGTVTNKGGAGWSCPF